MVEEHPVSMLDVHPPHAFIYSWKDFFVHIAIITIGLLIAIGLEQGVEYIHHRHQVREMSARLRQESIDNEAVIAFDIAGCDALLKSVESNLDALKSYRTPDAGKNWGVTTLPKPSTFVPADAAWLMLRDSALLALVPKTLAENQWKLETTREWMVQIGDDVQRSRVHLDALIGLDINANAPTLLNIDALRVAFSEYAENVRLYRFAASSYGTQIKRALAGESLDFGQIAQEESKVRP
jgi:hypothetical protein